MRGLAVWSPYTVVHLRFELRIFRLRVGCTNRCANGPCFSAWSVSCRDKLETLFRDLPGHHAPRLVSPTGFEPATSAFGGLCSSC